MTLRFGCKDEEGEGERGSERRKVPVKLVADSAAARLEVAQGLTLNPGHSLFALPAFLPPSLLLTYFAQAHTVPVEMQITSSPNMYDHACLRSTAIGDLYPNSGTRQYILKGPHKVGSAFSGLRAFFLAVADKGRV